MNPLTKGCYSKCGAAKGMNSRAGWKFKYGQNAWVTMCAHPSCIVSYSVMFYVYITETNFTSLDKQSSFDDTL